MASAVKHIRSKVGRTAVVAGLSMLIIKSSDPAHLCFSVLFRVVVGDEIVDILQ